MEASAEQRLILDQVYLDSVEFSHRSDALAVAANTPATVGEVLIEVQAARAPDERAGLLRVTVSTKPENKPAYNIRLSMIAICSLQPVPEQPPPSESTAASLTVRQFLEGPAIGLLYPFLREAFANVTMRGRFGPVWLALMDIRKIADGLAKAPETRQER